MDVDEVAETVVEEEVEDHPDHLKIEKTVLAIPLERTCESRPTKKLVTEWTTTLKTGALAVN